MRNGLLVGPFFHVRPAGGADRAQPGYVIGMKSGMS